MRSTKGTRHVSEIIRKAEKQIAGGNLAKAKQLLEDARKNEPNNEYIEAILERVTLLGLREEETPVQASDVSQETPGAPAVKPVEVMEDVASRVKQLTSVARDLYARGSVEPAFDSLMNAFMLDPLSRDVAQVESLILPAFEMMKKRGSVTIQQEVAPPTTAQILQQSVLKGGSSGRETSQLSRLEQLKQQKEQERLVKERAMWRKASEAPRLAEADDEAAISASEPQLVPPSPVKHRDGLLSRFWNGKQLE
jgi:hypothetical protein